MSRLVGYVEHLGDRHALTLGVDNADAVEGAPAHVQITGKPMMDEELLEIMKVVEGILKDTV